MYTCFEFLVVVFFPVQDDDAPTTLSVPPFADPVFQIVAACIQDEDIVPGACAAWTFLSGYKDQRDQLVQLGVDKQESILRLLFPHKFTAISKLF